MNKFFYLSVLIFLISFFLTLLYRNLALSRKVLDIPNERSSHLIPTPKGGGVAIVIAWYFGVTILFYFGNIPLNLYLALLSGIILAIISFIDDLIDIKPVLRLIAQILTSIIALYFLKGLEPFIFGKIIFSSQIVLFPITVLGIVWFINLYNFLDGIDGYASLETLTIGVVLLLVTWNPVCLLLCASLLGFIPWNWPKARIFMGDVGSTQLGFILVVLGIYFHNQSQLSFMHWVMLSSVFWFDATLTLFRRWRNHEKLSTAHKKHVYQRVVQSGFSHQKTICFSFIINLIIIGLVYTSICCNILLIPCFIINLLLLYGITLLVDKRFPFDTNK